MIVSLEIVLILLVNLYSQNECAKNNETTSNMYHSNTYTTTMISGNNTSSSNTATSTQSILDNNAVTIPNDPNTTTYALNNDQSTTLHLEISDTTTSQNVEFNDTTTSQYVENNDTTTSQYVENNDTTTSQSDESNDTSTSQSVENTDTTTSQSVENNATITIPATRDNDTFTTYKEINNDTTATSYLGNNNTTITPSQGNNDTEKSSSLRNNNRYTQLATSDNDSLSTPSMLYNDTTLNPNTLNNDINTTPITTENNANTTLSVVDNNASTSQLRENNQTSTAASIGDNNNTGSPLTKSTTSLFWNNDTFTILAVGINETTTTFVISNNDTTTSLYIENNTTSALLIDNNITYTTPVIRHPNATTSSATLNNHAFAMSSTEKTDTSTAFPTDTTMLFLTGDTKMTEVPVDTWKTSTLTSTINTDTVTLHSTWDNNTEAYTETTMPFPTHDNVTTSFPSTLDNNTADVSTEANARTTTPYQSNNTVTTTPSYTSVGKTTTQLSTTKIDVSTLSSTIIYAITALSSKNNVKTITPVAQFPTGIGSTIPTSLQLSTSKSRATTAKKADLAATVEVEIVIYLKTKIDITNFTDSSPEWRKMQKHLQDQYKSVPGFIGIYIFRFKPSQKGLQYRKRRQADVSLELAFKVIVVPYKKLTADKVKDTENETFAAIKLKTSDLIKTPSINQFKIVYDPVNILTRLDTEIRKINSPENKSKLLCGGLGYTFNRINKTCLSRCIGFVCLNNGLCILDIDGTPVCRCKADEKYVFSGDDCSTRGEKLELASEYIIAAACGSGGIIIIVAIIICLVCKSRNHKERQEKDCYITEHDTLSYNHPSALCGRQRTPSNLYLSMRDSTYNVDDRRYTVVEDVKRNTGNTYIYNPSAEPEKRPEMDDQSEHSYYNKSFCSEEFAIKRPHLRTERDFFPSDYSRSKTHRPDYM